MKEKELPEGWEWKRLGEIGKIFSGSTPSTSNSEYFDGEIPWITPADLSNFDGIYIEHGKKNITELGLKSSSTQLLPKDTILFSSRAPIGYVAIAANPVTTNQGFKNLVLKEGIYPKYVFYYLKTHKREMQQFGSGSTFLEVSAARFAKIPIILPPLPVQRQIVAVLEQTEALKRQRQEADALTGALLQSVFYEMFGDPVRNEKRWKTTSIGNISDHVSSGATPRGGSNVYETSGIMFIRSQNVHMNRLVKEDIAYISKDIHHSMQRSQVKNGDVLFNITGASIGRVAWFTEDDNSANVNQHVCIIRTDKSKILPEFLSYQLSIPMYQNKIMANQSGATRQAFNYTQIKNFEIVLPPLALQQQFARIVKDVERVREKQAESGKEIEALCGGLMQRAFAGELVG
ncbi:MAG: restriction endonuclease subunit S [Methanoregula sp.]|jgi:type I restriction enzyme S subunit